MAAVPLGRRPSSPRSYLPVTQSSSWSAAYGTSPRGDGPAPDPNEGIPIGPIGPEELQDPYLSELLSYSLDRLTKEPEILRADSERVQRQMQEVAVGHYRSFISAAQAVREIRTEIQSIDEHLGKLVEGIPPLTDGCQRFLEEAQGVQERRRVAKTMLANQPMLADLLEVPQLMDSCVRTGNFDEVLDLQAFAAKMLAMHAKLPIIQRLHSAAQRASHAMLLQLLQRLRSNIQLPECLRVIGYLRRLGTFSEGEMRLQFLRCREEWLADVIAELDTSSAYEFLKRVTDCHRVHLFDVVTQYRAVFADDAATAGGDLAADAAAAVALWAAPPSSQSSSSSSAPSKSSHALKAAAALAAVGGGAGAPSARPLEGLLLFGWAAHRVGLLLALLAEHLPRVEDGGSLASVLEHCMYCGLSLGRVGLDLRPLLSPLFESCVHSMFAKNLALAVASFHLSLDAHRWVPQPSIGSSFRSSAGDSADDVAPPYSLMEHPPLAVFVNGVLSSLNELRHCAPLSLRPQLAAHLESALAAVAAALLRFHRTRIVKDSEMALFLGTARTFVEVVSPYCALCFGKCFGASSATFDYRTSVKPLEALLNPTNDSSKTSETVDSTTLPENAKSNEASKDNGIS